MLLYDIYQKIKKVLNIKNVNLMLILILTIKKTILFRTKSLILLRQQPVGVQEWNLLP